jgi:hypothetical protein
MSDIGTILQKWHEAKKKAAILDQKIKKYKLQIAKEMNRREMDKLSGNGYSISRRRNTRTYVTKESVPSSIWNQYSTRCSYDSFHLVKK